MSEGWSRAVAQLRKESIRSPSALLLGLSTDQMVPPTLVRVIYNLPVQGLVPSRNPPAVTLELVLASMPLPQKMDVYIQLRTCCHKH